MDKYIDVHRLDKLFENKLKKIKNNKTLSPRNKELILQYLKDSELGKTIKKGQKRKIGAGRNIQAAGFLMSMATHWFNKDIDKVTLADMEKFILDLDKGKITSHKYKNKKNEPYSSEMKSNIKKFIRKFYKWLYGNGTSYPELVDWIDTSKKEAQIKAVPGLKNGVWQIVELIPDLRRKALVWALFDSGFREGEIINCKIKDLEKIKDTFYLTCTYSKTKSRTVSLSYATELIERWLEQHPDKDNPEAQLWQTSRIMLYKTVKLYGKKAHNINITVHMIRHTSATFWAPKLNRTVFCKRFGWSYASQSPDRYIDFSKMEEQQVVEIVTTDKYTDLKEELENQKAVNTNLADQLKAMQEQLNKRDESLIADIISKIKEREK